MRNRLVPKHLYFRKKQARRRSFRPLLEGLEDRVVPALTLMLETGTGATATVVDNGAGDENATPGVIVTTQNLDGFVAQTTVGVSFANSDLAGLHIENVAITGSSNGQLTVKLSDTDFSLSGPSTTARMTSAIGGVSDGSTSLQAFADNSNSLFGLSGVDVSTTGLQGPFSGAFDNTVVADIAVSDTFSLTLEATVTLDSPSDIQSFSADLQVQKLPALGDFVWNDLNGNGIQDVGEPGLEGVVVTLTGGGTDGVIGTADDTTQTTTTDAAGAYRFINLNPGEEYQVSFATPSGFEPTVADAGSDDALDSDADVATGAAPIVTLALGEFNSTIDAGFVQSAPVNPAIDIEKLTNGEDADNVGEAVEIAVGAPVVWTYLVTNTGDAPFNFSDVVVTDDSGTPDDPSDDLSVGNGITFVAASDVGGDLVLSPGETWQYDAVGVAQDLSAQSSLIVNGTYRLHNHPDGNAAPPLYGLRLNGLTTGNAADVFTFDFDHTDSNVTMTVQDGSIIIHGQVFGGRTDGAGGYVTGEAGLWQLDFTYDSSVTPVTGDDDVAVVAVGTGTGTITQLFGSLSSFDLVDYAGSHPFTFRLGNEDDDGGHRGFNGISGWGWLNHSGAPGGTSEHLAASDWLFTAELVTPAFENEAVVVATTTAGETVTDRDLSHYVNPAQVGGEGLTPGFWKQPQHFDSWFNYSPTDSFSTIFGVTATGDPTLLEALQANGGGEFALQRHATAALLNASSPMVLYLYTEAQVIDIVQQAYATGDFEAAKNLLEAQNELGWFPTDGSPIHLDFETDDIGNPLSAGDIIGGQFLMFGLTISSADATKPIMVFDTANPTGGDTDLATPGTGIGNNEPLGKVLIISEDGDSTDPDDNAAGGTMIFDWTNPVAVDEVRLLDIEESGGVIRAFDKDGNLIGTISIPAVGDNSAQRVTIGLEQVARLEVELAGSGAVSDILFRGQAKNNNQNVELSSIAGFVYEDSNGNGIKDAGEAGIAGVEVTLTGVNDLGQSVTILQTTLSDGSFEFFNLRPGTYSLIETQPSAYLDGAEKAGTSGGDTSIDDIISGISLAPGTDALDYLFAEIVRDDQNSEISGFVYHDRDNDGVRDAGEEGIEWATVRLTGVDIDGNAVSLTAVTDSDGSYRFGNLRPGTYQLFEEQPDGYLDGKDAIGSAGGVQEANDQIKNIVLGSGDTGEDYNFGELKKASLSGYVYLDKDNDGIRDRNERGIKGVWIILRGVDDLGNKIERVTRTNKKGYYEFDGLRVGVYEIEELQPKRYRDGKDTVGSLGGDVENDKFTNIQVNSGDQGTDYNFGELAKKQHRWRGNRFWSWFCSWHKR